MNQADLKKQNVTVFQPLSPVGAEGGHRLDELIDQSVQQLLPFVVAGASRQVIAMKLPAAAYSAEVATSATKAGSYRVFGEGE